MPQKAVVIWTLLRKVPMGGRKGARSCSQLVINAPKSSHANVSSRDVAHGVEIQLTLCQVRSASGSPPAQEIMAGLSFVRYGLCMAQWLISNSETPGNPCSPCSSDFSSRSK